MTTGTTRTPEVALPVAALGAVMEALNAQLGPEAAADALRTAGYAAGDAFFRILAGSSPDELKTLPADRFWGRLGMLFSARGWGHFRYEQAHPGVGSLESADWVESRTDSVAEQPACHFTTGLLANLLGNVAGAEVGVIEVECRSRGDGRCRFLFGGTDAVYAVYHRMAEGESSDAALEGIG
ncbi:MAG TPA: V4R domain-containing protein [Longimicrobiales bacterium]|nr:V4R domain-containing protein [Longimicrobiales bacterium]